MLVELRVRNYALLEQVNLSLSAGFTVLTGETGAGKSLLVGAIGLLLGDKTQAQSIRQGADEAEVVGVVRLTSDGHEQLRVIIKELDIVLDEDVLELRRVIRVKGSSTIYANGVRITREQLQKIAVLLFDMHGQHEHQSLYNLDNQRILLDKAAKISEQVVSFGELFGRLKSLRQELKSIQEQRQRLESERSYLERAYEEIEQLDPSEEQKEELLTLAKELESAERSSEAIAKSYHTLKSTSAVMLELKSVSQGLRGVAWSELKVLHRRLEEAMLELEDVGESLGQRLEHLRGGAGELERVQKSLIEYQRLEKKYGGGHLAGLLKFRQSMTRELETLEQSSDEEQHLSEEIGELEQRLRNQAQQISKQRAHCIEQLELEVGVLLKELSLPNAQFKIELSPRRNKSGERSIGVHGGDEIQFLFSANAGEPLRALKEVASGGESSRILLILKSVLARQEEVDCLIFDEIDTGVGGEAAVQVAKHMRKLGSCKQVLCITHLASIASAAQTQFKIEKQSVDDYTSTAIYEVKGQARVEEIARMLSGSTDLRALEHAQLLLGLNIEEVDGKKEYNQS